MKMLWTIALSVLLPAAALAQQVPAGYQAPVSPPFAPVTLDKEPYDQIVAYINTRLPTGEGRPLIEALERLEMQAAMKAQADAAKKPPTEPPKPADPR